MTLKSVIIYRIRVVALQIIHEAWRMLWDYLVHSPTKNVLSPQTFVDIQDLLKI